MAYKILHLPTATYMYHSLNIDGKTNTKNFYTQYEIESGYYSFDDSPATSIFRNRNMASRFLDRWDKLKELEDNDGVDYLLFKDNEEYVFQRYHFSIIKVDDV